MQGHSIANSFNQLISIVNVYLIRSFAFFPGIFSNNGRASALSHLSTVIISTVISTLFLFSFLTGNAQTQEPHKAEKTRILFLLDASGSMNAKWEGQKMFNVARQLLTDIVDSVQIATDNVEFGLRMYGHQSPRKEKDCQDTKLEVPFGSENAEAINRAMKSADPQGWTPIAYSLFQAAKDFPEKSSRVKNALILITDGLETCDGDLCAAGRLLRKKRVTLKPFIIGMGLGDQEEYFDCVGQYYDASKAEGFKKVSNLVVSQSLGNTTTQVNLLDKNNQPTITNVPMTFYDAYSGQVLYNFIHTLDKNGNPDTLFLDPTGTYNLTVHTTPTLHKKGIELNPGTHNIIGLRANKGDLTLKEKNKRGNSQARCVVRKAKSHAFVNVQDFNKTRDYLNDDYELDIFTFPRQQNNSLQISEEKPREITIQEPGQITFLTDKLLIGSIYKIENRNWHKLYEFKPFKGRQTLAIQPGTYKFVYRPQDASKAERTKVKPINMKEGGNVLLKF